MANPRFLIWVRIRCSSGRVTSLELVAPSGYEALDASVLRAIQDAQPFPPFPSELGSGPQTVQFAFDLNK